MTTLDENEALEAGEWGVIITRVAQAIRRECGEATANRVVTLLHEQKREAIDAMRAQIESANATLETTLSEVADARRAHERLQLDLSRMEAAVREARTEAAAIRAKASSDAAEAKGAIAATAEAELVEWEADLVRRSQDLEQRRTTPTLPPPGPNIAGWGSRRTN